MAWIFKNILFKTILTFTKYSPAHLLMQYLFYINTTVIWTFNNDNLLILWDWGIVLPTKQPAKLLLSFVKVGVSK